MTARSRHAPACGNAQRRRGALVAIVLLAVAACSLPGQKHREGVEIEITAADPEAGGGIRAAIDAANMATKKAWITSRLPPGTVVHISNELPALAGRDIELDARGLVLVSNGCVRGDGRKGCSGLVVTGERIVVRDLTVTEFLFDGISVRGARGARIIGGRFYRNQDDGIGVSDGAADVEIASCLLEENGFRTKGKGVLVFDGSRALLKSNRIVGNRDGVTVSKRSHAVLEGNEILDSYDKGLGVTGASAEARGDRIVGSGAGRSQRGPGPNADGVRASLDATVTLNGVTVTGSGDRGVVATGDSRVTIAGGRIEQNRGSDVAATERASLVIDGRELRGPDYGKPKPVKPVPVKPPLSPAPPRSDPARRT